MKKQFFFGMVAAAALCGCSNNEVEQFQANNEQNAIQFGVYVGQSVNGRAAQTVITNVESAITSGVNNKGGFGIFGYYTGTSDYATGTTPNFMYNQKVEKGANSDWTYTPLKYWPNTTYEKVSFFAYSPYSPSDVTENEDGSKSVTDNDNITAFSANTATTEPTVTFKVNTTVKDQQDLLYAQSLNNKQTITTGTAGLKIADPVVFAFQHALSCIGFNVEASFDKVIPNTGTTDGGTDDNGTQPTETTIAVTSVELSGNFYPSGTLNLNKAANDTPWNPATAQSITFSLTDANTNFKTAVSNYGVSTTKQQLNEDDSYIMVIPQVFANTDQIKIKVVYKVKTTDAALNGGSSEITHTVESAPFDFTFEQGKKHWFNLHLGLTSASFSATVTGWEDSSTSAETIVNVPLNQANN